MGDFQDHNGLPIVDLPDWLADLIGESAEKIEEKGFHSSEENKKVRRNRSATYRKLRDQKEEKISKGDNKKVPEMNFGDIYGAPDPGSPLFKNGVQRGEFGILSGPSGIGKSFVIQELAISLATGKPVIPGLAPNEPCKVLLIHMEDPLGQLRKRQEAIAGLYEEPVPSVLGPEHKGVSRGSQVTSSDIRKAITDNKIRFWSPDGALVRHQPRKPDGDEGAYEEGGVRPTGWYKALDRGIAAYGFDLIIVDPLINAIRVPSENDNMEMLEVAEILASLARKHDIAIIAVTHTSQSGGSSASQYASRGASSFVGRCKWNAQLVMNSKAERLELYFPKNSYMEDILHPVCLKRGAGGALREVPWEPEEKESFSIDDTEEWLAGWLRDNPDSPVLFSLDSKNPVVKSVFADFQKEFPEVEKAEIPKVLKGAREQGLQSGLFEKATLPNANRVPQQFLALVTGEGA
jgi:hypothetical protein